MTIVAGDRRPLRRTVFAAGFVGLTSCSARIGMPEPGTQEGDSVIGLWRVLFWTAAALGALVVVLLGWCLVRYRARGPDDGTLPPQVRGNLRLEAFYIAVPTVIVAGIFVVSLRAEPSPAGPRRADALRIDVTGFQWQWRFDYPDQAVSIVGQPESPPEMVLPLGRPVDLRLSSPDVIHSFWVPGFLGKVDVIPGQDHHFRLRPVRAARYSGFCAEFCGLNHARMNFSVRVVPADEFDEWASRAAARR